MKLDYMLQIMRSLVKDDSTKDPAEYAMVHTLRLLGLLGYSEGRWKATPELIRLAYQSEKFLSENCLALEFPDTSDEDLEDLTDEDAYFDDVPKKKRRISSMKKATPKVGASSSKKKVK